MTKMLAGMFPNMKAMINQTAGANIENANKIVNTMEIGWAFFPIFFLFALVVLFLASTQKNEAQRYRR